MSADGGHIRERTPTTRFAGCCARPASGHATGIAVVRAAKKIARLDWFASDTLGGQLVFFDPLNVMSYAMARLKGDNFGGYRNNDRRRRWRQETQAQLRARLVEGGDHHQYVGKDGSWRRQGEIERSKPGDDPKPAARLQGVPAAH